MGQEQSSQQAPGAWPKKPKTETSISPGQKSALIAVCGITGSGKSTFIQHVTGQKVKIGHKLHSETSSVQEYEFKMGQLSVTLVDTPGFDDTDLSDTEVLTILTNWLQTSYIEGTRLCGMIYLHPITQVRMGNTSARNLKLFRKLCGDENLGNVLLVTNKWEICDGRTAEGRFQDLTAAGGFWRRLLDLGASAHRYYNDREEAMNLIKKLIAKQPIALNIQKQLVEEKKSLIDTDVGSVVHADLLRLEEEHVKEMNRMHEKLRDSQRKGNQELRRHLKTQQDEAKEELQKVNDSKVQLMAQVAKLQKQQEDSERAILAMASRSEQDRRAHALQMAALRRDEMESLRLENERRIADRQRQEQADRRRQALQDVQMQRLAQQMQQSTLRHQLTTPHQSPWSSDRSVQCFSCRGTFSSATFPPPPFDVVCVYCGVSLKVISFVG